MRILLLLSVLLIAGCTSEKYREVKLDLSLCRHTVEKLTQERFNYQEERRKLFAVDFKKDFYKCINGKLHRLIENEIYEKTKGDCTVVKKEV